MVLTIPCPGREADGPLFLLVGGIHSLICGLRVWEGCPPSQLVYLYLSFVVFLVLWPQSLSKLNLLGRTRDVGAPRSPRQRET